MEERIDIDKLGTDIDDSTNTGKLVRERFKKEGLSLSIIIDDKDKYNNIKCPQCGNSCLSKLKIKEDVHDTILLCYKCGCISTIRLNEGKYEPIKCLICNSKTTKISDDYGYFYKTPIWYQILPMDDSDDSIKKDYVCWYCMQTQSEEIDKIVEEYKRKENEEQRKIEKERLENRMNKLLKMSKEELINEIVELDKEVSNYSDFEDW